MSKPGAPTLTDVARRAGVNKVTASIALSGGQGNTRVSAATRERIFAAARDLHYQPNALARSLRRRQTNIVGLYMGGFIDTRNLFLSEILSGLQLGCEQNRHDFLMHGTFRGDSTEDIYAELVNGKVDGLVMHVATNNTLVQRLASCHLPIVAIVDPVPGIPSVIVDDHAGARIQAQYLAEKGHRHVLYGACPFPLTSTKRRQEAFCHAARELGMEVRVDLARKDDDIPSPVEHLYLEMEPDTRPTAFVGWCDRFAYLFTEHVRRHGVNVPQDLAVVGFDGSTSVIPAAYRLTTVNAPWREVARTAVSLLLSQNEGEPLPEETVLPVELVAGDTA